MEQGWRQILVAVLLGSLAPQLIFSAMGWLLPTRTQEEPPRQTEQQTIPMTTVDDPAEAVTYIPVQTEDGIIAVMELETYVIGVVLGEMPASFEPEALKAQAVVARTYGLHRWTSGWRHGEGGVCTDPSCCQDYISEADYINSGMGNREDIEAVKTAVLETKGLVLVYQGELIEATYFSCSGGRTEDAVAVWGSEIPYLQAVDSPGEEIAGNFRAEKRFASAEFSRLLGRSLAGDPESWLGTVHYTDGGGVAGMYIGGLYYTGIQLRQLLGLNSTAFTITVEEDELRIQTRGKGHRVGMSQYGAEAMAVAGSDYEEILYHYYPGTRIDKIDPME